jgi:hypothetical protein
MNPRVVHFHFPIFGTLFIPIDTESRFIGTGGDLAANLDTVWNHPQTDGRLKKRIVRELI